MLKYNIFVAILFVAIFKGGESVFWPCESSNDCTANGSQCSIEDGQCECDNFDDVFSEDFSQCLATSLYGDTCEESIQCNLMPSGAICNTGVCDCVDGLTYVRGRCRLLKSLDESCDTDLDCYFGYDRQSVTCENKVCSCANGYYHRNGNICRRKSMEIDDACVVDEDCIELGTNVKCVSLTCQYVDERKSDSSAQLINTRNSVKQVKTQKYVSTSTTTPTEGTSLSSKSTKSENNQDIPALVNGRDDLNEPDSNPTHRLREIAVQTSIDSFELKPLSSTHEKRIGSAIASTSTSSRRFSHHRHLLSSFRQDDEDKTYSTLSNTDEDVDDRRYGSLCKDNGKLCSGLPHSICSNSLCLCKLGYYHKSGKCFAELGEIAESTNECENTFDELSNKCICQKNYFYERNLRSCRKPIQYHLSCTSNSQCSPFGAAYCHSEIPRRCTCDDYAEYDSLQQMCVYKQGLGSQCDTNDVCIVENSVCSNNLCVCKDNLFEKDGACVAGIGAVCETNTDCNADNSVCGDLSNSENKEKTCQCKKGFVHFKDECLKESEDLDDECVETEQCKPLLGTCIENKCTCTVDQHFRYGQCENKKGLGDACIREGECYIETDQENVECRNSVCQCKFDYQADTTQKTCIRVIPNKKNSSGRPSALKIITFLLIGSAFLITSAAIKQAYY